MHPFSLSHFVPVLHVCSFFPPSSFLPLFIGWRRFPGNALLRNRAVLWQLSTVPILCHPPLLSFSQISLPFFLVSLQYPLFPPHAASNKMDSPCEIIKDRLFFVTARSTPVNTDREYYFCVDDELCYESFYADFGPLNLGMLYRFCVRLNNILESPEHKDKTIHYYTSYDVHKRSNAAFLIGAFSVIYLERLPEEAYRPLADITPPLLPFRDASYGSCTFKLTVLDCLRGIHMALVNKFFDFSTFNVAEYHFYERVENGDFNIIVPGKFIAFAGPRAETRIVNGYPFLAPEHYHDLFGARGVTDIVRLNTKEYEASRFTSAGFKHHDLFFIDGSTPPEDILVSFLSLAEAAKGAVAIHCKAGLGRTGTLIGCYMMKHFHFTALEAIAWLRIARPGSVIGPQQYYMQQAQDRMHADGARLKVRRASDADRPAWARSSLYHAAKPFMIARPKELLHRQQHAHTHSTRLSPVPQPTGNVSPVPFAHEGEEPPAEEGQPSQGDFLTALKAQRCMRTPLRIAPDNSSQMTPIKVRPIPATGGASITKV